MSMLTLSAKLDRSEASTSWGFRLYGGKDFGAPLTIQRVTPGSLAAKCGLQVGDVITKIGDCPTDVLLHEDAKRQIVACGNSIELTLQRGSGGHRAPPSSGGQYAPSPAAYQPQVAQPMPLGAPAGGGGGLPGPSPPWQSQPKASPTYGSAPSPRGPSGPAPPAPGTWNPTIPTGPRKMKFYKMGEAKNISAPAGGRIPICGNCGIQIRGPFVLALDKSFCPNHFVCANPHCGTNLIHCGFVEEEGSLYCERDYQQYFAPRCNKCGDAIMGDCVNALNQHFHPQCFLCAHCRQPVGAGAFHLEDSNVYCEKDWQALFQTKCFGCQFPIEPGDRWVEALGQNWHSECFNCSTCQVNLEGQPFYAKSGRPYCKRHASKF